MEERSARCGVISRRQWEAEKAANRRAQQRTADMRATPPEVFATVEQRISGVEPGFLEWLEARTKEVQRMTADLQQLISERPAPTAPPKPSAADDIQFRMWLRDRNRR